MLVDTHTHLFSDQFDEDRTKIIEQAIEQGVSKLFLPNVSVASLDKMLQLHKQFPNNCFPMAGLHPCDVKKNYIQHLDHIREWIENNKEQTFGIGETGLDYYWDTSFVPEQKQSLQVHAKWAKELNLPIVLHTRDSFGDNLAIMQEEQNGDLCGVFHCFTGTWEEAQQIIDLGFYIGLGGVVTFKNSGKALRKAVETIPLQHIVLETDSPYLAPHPNRGKRNDSSMLPLIAQTIANVKNISFDEVAEQTTKNAEQLFQLNFQNV